MKAITPNIGTTTHTHIHSVSTNWSPGSVAARQSHIAKKLIINSAGNASAMWQPSLLVVPYCLKVTVAEYRNKVSLSYQNFL